LKEEYLVQPSAMLYYHIIRSIHAAGKETLGERDHNHYRSRNAFDGMKN
jgi:hypothetical protein